MKYWLWVMVFIAVATSLQLKDCEKRLEEADTKLIDLMSKAEYWSKESKRGQ